MTTAQSLRRRLVLLAVCGGLVAVLSAGARAGSAGFQVSGVVAEFPVGCQGAMRGVTVRLEPPGMEAQTSLADGSFAFAAVAPGDYSLTVSPSCNPFGCWPETAVRVVDQDVFHRICPEAAAPSPTLTQSPTPTPTSNRPPAIARGLATPNPARSGQQVSLLDDGSFGGVAGRRWDQREGPLVELTGFPPSFVAPHVLAPVVFVFDYSVCNFDTGCDIDRVEVTILPPECPRDCPRTPTPTPSITPTGFPFNTPSIRCELTVEPAAPRTGDHVRVTVHRTSNGLGYPQYRLQADPLFAGGVEEQSSSTFERDAVQVGMTTLRGSTTDEFVVGYNGNDPIYSFVSANCTVEVLVIDGGPVRTATPTPTPTQTSTPTRTNPPGSCCGESCGGLSFRECLAAAQNGECVGWGDPCELLPPTCSEVPGFVSFNGLQVEPAQPKVGDEVELRFDVDLRVYAVERVELQGAAPYLEEGTRSGMTFELTATQAGRAALRVAVTYGTERMCVDGRGNTYFDVGPSRTAISPVYDVEIAESSPTMTPTATVVPGVTPEEDGDDGCQLDRGRGSGLGSLALWLGLVLIVGARRRQ